MYFGNSFCYTPVRRYYRFQKVKVLCTFKKLKKMMFKNCLLPGNLEKKTFVTFSGRLSINIVCLSLFSLSIKSQSTQNLSRECEIKSDPSVNFYPYVNINRVSNNQAKDK